MVTGRAFIRLQSRSTFFLVIISHFFFSRTA